jgi:hypothetical protein
MGHHKQTLKRKQGGAIGAARICRVQFRLVERDKAVARFALKRIQEGA